MTTFAASVTIVDLPTGTTVTGTELIEAVQTSSGVGQSVQLTLSQVLALGGLPTGGNTGTILNKSSGSNYSTQFSPITTFISTDGSLMTTGTVTSIVVALATNVNVTGTLTVIGTSNLSGVVNTGTLGQIGTALVTGAFGVVGTTIITGQFTASQSAILSGGLTVVGTTNLAAIVNTGTLGQVGTSLLTGMVGIVGTSLVTGTLSVVGTATLGTTSVAGTAALTVTGIASATKFQGDGSLLSGVVATTTLPSLIVLGSATVSGSLTASTTFSALGTASFSGGIVATGTLGLVGTASFTSNAFNVVGTASFTSSAFNVVGTTNFTGVHGVAGTATFTSGAFNVVGTASFTSNAFNVVGTSTFTGTFVLGSQATGILTSSGTGVVSAQGGMVLLNTLSPNGVASVSDVTSLTSAYKQYMVMFNGICPATSAAWLQVTIATSGSNWIATNYASYINYITGGVNPGDSSSTAMILTGTRSTTGVATALVYGVSGFIKIFNPASSTSNPWFMGETSWVVPGNISSSNATGFIALGTPFAIWNANNTAAPAGPITGINFAFNSGNIQTGTIKIYGIT